MLSCEIGWDSSRMLSRIDIHRWGAPVSASEGHGVRVTAESAVCLEQMNVVLAKFIQKLVTGQYTYFMREIHQPRLRLDHCNRSRQWRPS
jgi:hypothetical protein